MKRNRPTVHHLLWKWAGGSNVAENKITLPEHKHRAIHLLFGIESIKWQIETLLELNTTALQWDYVRDIQIVLDLYKWEEYHANIKK